MNFNFNFINTDKPLNISKPANCYKNDMRSALTTISEINKYFLTHINELSYKVFLPKNFARKIKKAGPHSPLWKQFIPDSIEDNPVMQEFGMLDPIGDKIHQKTGPIIHRYNNRLLFFPTNICPIACRYCFRKNELDNSPELFNMQYNSTLKYIQNHKEIDEIIFSGGDPFILNDSKLKSYLEDFSKFDHIKYIRFHTRTPIILPNRITSSLIEILKSQKKKIIIAIHTNHIDEIDAEVESAIQKLTKSNATLLSQSVLLKGVNDTTEDLYNLIYKIVDLNIRPYYLHHPDRVKGAMHFYIPLEQGRKLYASLKGQLSGWACPQYIIDIPGGEGKTQAFNPETFKFSGNLINKEGIIVSTPTKIGHNTSSKQ